MPNFSSLTWCGNYLVVHLVRSLLCRIDYHYVEDVDSYGVQYYSNLSSFLLGPKDNKLKVEDVISLWDLVSMWGWETLLRCWCEETGIRFIWKPLRTNVYATIVQVACDDINIPYFHSGRLLVDRLGLKSQYTSSSGCLFIMKYPMQGLFFTNPRDFPIGCDRKVPSVCLVPGQLVWMFVWHCIPIDYVHWFLQTYISGGGEGNFS